MELSGRGGGILDPFRLDVEEGFAFPGTTLRVDMETCCCVGIVWSVGCRFAHLKIIGPPWCLSFGTREAFSGV